MIIKKHLNYIRPEKYAKHIFERFWKISKIFQKNQDFL